MDDHHIALSVSWLATPDDVGTPMLRSIDGTVLKNAREPMVVRGGETGAKLPETSPKLEVHPETS